MAFLVCFSQTLKDHTNDKAIYLDQNFYELIYGNCRTEAFPLLRQIASLKYKSPTIILSGHQVAALNQELTALTQIQLSHPQIPEFRKVCERATSDNCSLLISGDMYPEL